MKKIYLPQKIFSILFVLSSLLAFSFYAIEYWIENSLNTHTLLSLDTQIITSIVASLISLAGLIITTYLSFKREKREAREFDLTLKQKEIELEKIRLELEKLKQELKKKK